MLRRSFMFGSFIALSSCSSSGLYKGLTKESKNFRTPDPINTQQFPVRPYFPTWYDNDEPYRFYPGDEIELNVISAPELSRTMIVAPDGRISANLIGSIMAADRTPAELQQILESKYASQLKNPAVTIAPKAFASQKIFVGGEVARPGIYDLPGEIDPLQAITMAGGFMNTARREEVVVLRRGPGGQPFQRIFDLKSAFSSEQLYATLPRLRRLDIIWVPKSRISEVGLWTQQFVKDALPITFSFNYAINGFQNF